MEFEWNEIKRTTNIRVRQLDFEDAAEMFGKPMLTQPDNRSPYGEMRQVGMGYVKGRLMVVVFTERKRDVIRIISYRKANKREQAKYEKAIKNKLEIH